MKIKTFLVVMVMMVSSILAAADKVITLGEIGKPDGIAVDDQQIYIAEVATIYILSRDGKLKKKFGKRGEGPEEFLVVPNLPLNITCRPDDLVIGSFGKVSYYSKDGVYKREKKVGAGLFNGLFRPIGDGFVGMRVTSKDNIAYVSVTLFDASLKPGAELYKFPATNKAGKRVLLRQAFDFRPYKNQIFTTGKEGLSVDVMDASGKKLYGISYKDYKKRKITSKDIENMKKTLKLMLRGQYDQFKNLFVYPTDYFPAVQSIEVTGDVLYVLTWNMQDEKNVVFLFDLKGKFLKKAIIPFYMMDAFRPWPFVIFKEQIFQIFENEDDEEWELHITSIK